MALDPSSIPRGNIDGNWLLQITISPSSVAPNTTAEQTFSVTGLLLGDYCEINKPTAQGGLGIVNSRASAAGVLAVTFANTTTGTITPTSNETYLLQVTRTVNIVSNLPTLTQIPT